jgi:signal transduction histidine kinase
VLLCLGRLRAQADEPVELLDFAIDELAAGLDEIRTLASGLHPSLLSERGLARAIEALALRVPMAIELDALPDRRLPEPIEAAAYYVVAEALANVQKHAGAGRVVVSVTADDGTLDVSVGDDGVGGADADGHGLRGLADSVEALGGRLTVESPAHGGTVLRAALPGLAAGSMVRPRAAAALRGAKQHHRGKGVPALGTGPRGVSLAGDRSSRHRASSC